MKPLICIFVLLTFLFQSEEIIADCGKSGILIMPKELVEVAEKNGYTQVDDFYCKKIQRVNPCYVYGYIYSENPIDAEKSAVFWARKVEKDPNTIYLLFVSRSAGYLPFTLDDAIEVDFRPGGLSVVRDTSITLDKFYFLKDYSKKGPANIKAKGNIISERYDGVGNDYYNYNGEWLVREWD